MPICFYNSLPIGECSNLLILAVFLANCFLVKHLLKKSHLLIFPDEKAEIIALSLSMSY